MSQQYTSGGINSAQKKAAMRGGDPDAPNRKRMDSGIDVMDYTITDQDPNEDMMNSNNGLPQRSSRSDNNSPPSILKKKTSLRQNPQSVENESNARNNYRRQRSEDKIDRGPKYPTFSNKDQIVDV